MLHCFGLVWLQRCNAKAEEQHSELHHTEEPCSDPAMGSNSQNKIRKTRSLGCFFLSFLAPLPMKCLRQGETGSIPWNHWYEKLEYPHCPWPWETAHPQTEMLLLRRGLGGAGDVSRASWDQQGHTALGRARGMSCFVPESALGGVKEMQERLPRRAHMNSQLAAAARSICSAQHSLQHKAVLLK